MKYCPKCKRLYNDEDELCSREECKHKRLEPVEDETTSVYLCTGDLVERDRVQTALKDSGIPSVFVRRMVSANSQLVTGVDYDGFDILVPFELYEKAFDVAVGIGAITLDEEEKNVPEPLPIEEMSRTKRTWVRVLSAFLLILVFAGVIFGVDAIMNAIKSLFT